MATDERSRTLYINDETLRRMVRLVERLEALHVIGLRHGNGTINKSALLRYMLTHAEERLDA